MVRRTAVPGISGDTALGIRYQETKEYNDLSGGAFQWVGTGGNSLSPYGAIPSFSTKAPTVSPIRVVALSPRYVSTSEPLSVTWDCSNPVVDITISRDGGTAQRSWIPVLQLRVTNVKGGVSIPTKILEVLPVNRYQQFLFTFSSSTDSVVTMAGYSDEVLIRSASIHNILLDVHQ